MKTPDIHDAILAMEQVGLRPQVMSLRCQCAGCKEEIQIDTGEAMAASDYLAKVCKVYGWDSDNYLCPVHMSAKAKADAKADAEWNLEAEREDAA